jgi:hypothetical protein
VTIVAEKATRASDKDKDKDKKEQIPTIKKDPESDTERRVHIFKPKKEGEKPNRSKSV